MSTRKTAAPAKSPTKSPAASPATAAAKASAAAPGSRRPAGKTPAAAAKPTKPAQAGAAAEKTKANKATKETKGTKAPESAKATKAVTVAKPATPPQAAKPAKPAKPAKAPKQQDKPVRDSFTMPEADFALIAALKQRAMAAQRETKKSELLRAGLHALAAMDTPALLSALGKLATVKIGRPKKGH